MSLRGPKNYFSQDKVALEINSAIKYAQKPTQQDAELTDRLCKTQPDISSSELSGSLSSKSSKKSKSSKRSRSSSTITDKERVSSDSENSSPNSKRLKLKPPKPQNSESSQRLTQENLSILQHDILLGLTPHKKHARILKTNHEETQRSIGEIIGRGAQKNVHSLTEDWVFLSSKQPLEKSNRAFGISSLTPNKTHGIAQRGIDGRNAIRLPVGSQIKILALLTLDLRRFHMDDNKCHMDLKPDNFCFKLDQATQEVTKAHWIDHDSAKKIQDPLLFCIGTPESSAPEVTKQYELLNLPNLESLLEFSKIDFHSDTELGRTLISKIPFFADLFPEIITTSTSCKAIKVHEIRQTILLNKKFADKDPTLKNNPLYPDLLNSFFNKLYNYREKSFVSTKIDIWAFGCTIIKLVVGRNLNSFYPGEISQGRKLFKELAEVLYKAGYNNQAIELATYKLYNKMFHIFHTTATPETLANVKRNVFNFVNSSSADSTTKYVKSKLLDIAFKCLEKNDSHCIYLNTIFDDLNSVAQELQEGSETTDEDSLFSIDNKFIFEPTAPTEKIHELNSQADDILSVSSISDT